MVKCGNFMRVPPAGSRYFAFVRQLLACAAPAEHRSSLEAGGVEVEWSECPSASDEFGRHVRPRLYGGMQFWSFKSNHLPTFKARCNVGKFRL